MVVSVLCKINLIKYMLSWLIMRGKISKQIIVLLEFNLQYITQKTIKGQELADFVRNHPYTDIDENVLKEIDIEAIGIKP